MSNSIWHKSGLEVPATDNKARISRGGDIIYWTPYGWSHPKSYNHHRIGCEWAYLEDIIAQAEKAERLQKAVDFLSGHLRNVLQLDEYGHIKLDEITKQQIKSAISDPVGIITQLEQESNN